MEFIDGLVVVADCHNTGVFVVGEKFDDFELGGVGILKFVEQDELVAFGKGEAETGVGFEGLDGFFNHVVEVEETVVSEVLVVDGHDVGERGEFFVGDAVFEAVGVFLGFFEIVIFPCRERSDFLEGVGFVEGGFEVSGDGVDDAVDIFQDFRCVLEVFEDFENGRIDFLEVFFELPGDEIFEERRDLVAEDLAIIDVQGGDGGEVGGREAGGFGGADGFDDIFDAVALQDVGGGERFLDVADDFVGGDFIDG